MIYPLHNGPFHGKVIELPDPDEAPKEIFYLHSPTPYVQGDVMMVAQAHIYSFQWFSGAGGKNYGYTYSGLSEIFPVELVRNADLENTDLSEEYATILNAHGALHASSDPVDLVSDIALSPSGDPPTGRIDIADDTVRRRGRPPRLPATS